MEEIIVTTHLRNAAGVCALSIGLLVCSSGGAIAFADQTDPGGAATGTGTATTGDDTTTPTSNDPISTVGNQLTDVDPIDITTTTSTGTTITGLASGGSPVTKIEAQTNTSTTSQDDLDAAAITALDLDEGEVGTSPSSVVETPPTQAFTPAPYVYTPPSGSSVAQDESTKPAPHEGGFAGPTALSDSKKFGSTTITEPGPFTKTVVLPVSNAVVSIARALGQVTFTLAHLPTSQTPITDVIMSMSIMVGSVVGAVVEVAQVPGDLASLLGANPDEVAPPLIGAGGAVDRAIRIPVDRPVLGPEVSQAPMLPVATVDAPLFGSVIQTSNIGSVAATGLKNELSFSGLAPVPSGVSPATTSFLDHVVSSVLVPASLTALAAIAVPGIGGLLIVCAAGVRVGYRQAKAGLALRASGIARFAGPGPMGVVRSGSLIALHTPRLRKTHATPAVAAKTANGPRLLESVA